MRRITKIMKDWQFTGPNGVTTAVELPHTWNARDGQDGGNDYWRGTCTYCTRFAAPALRPAPQQVWLQFEGVNASADVLLNGQQLCTHDGGYSTFRANVTELLRERTSSPSGGQQHQRPRLPPESRLHLLRRHLPRCQPDGGEQKPHRAGTLRRHRREDHPGPAGQQRRHPGGNAGGRQGTVTVELLDAEGRTAAKGEGENTFLHLDAPHLWNGIKDPYLYTCVVRLLQDGKPVDEVTTKVGLRSFSVDPKKGFFLNGRPYPLHGVSAIRTARVWATPSPGEMHDEDMALIRELGANTVRLAHYQHDQYFYDLCDQYGMVVWAEIPYISEHLPNGRANTISQMKELISRTTTTPASSAGAFPTRSPSPPRTRRICWTTTAS